MSRRQALGFFTASAALLFGGQTDRPIVVGITQWTRPEAFGSARIGG